MKLTKLMKDWQKKLISGANIGGGLALARTNDIARLLATIT
jgi:hypothetical protein